MGENAVIEGNIKAKEIYISGYTVGNVKANKIEILSYGTLKGDMKSEHFYIDEGGVFEPKDTNTKDKIVAS